MQNFNEIRPILDTKKCFIFDMDNTIINLNANWTLIKNNLSDLAQEKFNEQISFQPLWEGCKYTKKRFGKEEMPPFYKLLEDEENRAAKNQSEINSHGFEIFSRVLNQYKNRNDKKTYFGILSNNFRTTIEIILRRFDLLNELDFYFGRDTVPKMKPQPDGLKLIQTSLDNIQKEDLILFGDSKWDKMAAESFGITYINVHKIAINQ